MSNDNQNNFESLYNNLKEEYEQCKKDNDEICKEYEQTIQLLTDSVESMEKEKKDLQIKLSKIENEQKAFKKEKDTLIKKNKDKIIDIQCLNEQNDKLNKIIKKLKEEKSLFDNKIVTLENDIDHYQNKIREYEDFIDELKAQLEDALEENITLQTEFETYKLNTGDQLIRKEEELRDIKNDITNKDKIIQKLTKKPSERFNIQMEQEKLNSDKKRITWKRRYTVLESNSNFKFKRRFQKHLTHLKEYENENDNIRDFKGYRNNKFIRSQLNVIMEDDAYNKAFHKGKTFQINQEDENKKKDKNKENENKEKDENKEIENKESENKEKEDEKKESENIEKKDENKESENKENKDNENKVSENKENNENIENKDNKNNEMNNSNISYNTDNNENKSDANEILNFNHDSENNNENIDIENNEIKDNLNINEDKNINIKLEQNNGVIKLGSLINKQFGDLVICEENKIYVNPLVNKLLSKEQKKNLKLSLKNMIIRIKERKLNLNNKKNTIKGLFDKSPFRIK